ncbi:MAG: T9SS type A sorting domain-containing protein, partial [Bacteroidales bacterium]|nr:T9SS type A sorting domain-containing protein [Bacteroidales bacterium]
NPASDYVNISIADIDFNTTVWYEIMNAKGQLVAKKNVYQEETIIDVTSYDKGLYFIRLVGLEQPVAMPIVIE